MKFRLLGVALSVALLGSGEVKTVFSAEVEKEDCFYLKSLHYTAAGMEYWYSEENGGLERLTGIPYEELTCKNCHAGGCDRCHKVEHKEKDCTFYEYSTGAASKQKLCLACHGREGAMIRINHKEGREDVHLSMGMVCVDCHRSPRSRSRRCRRNSIPRRPGWATELQVRSVPVSRWGRPRVHDARRPVLAG